MISRSIVKVAWFIRRNVPLVLKQFWDRIRSDNLHVKKIQCSYSVPSLGGFWQNIKIVDTFCIKHYCLKIIKPTRFAELNQKSFQAKGFLRIFPHNNQISRHSFRMKSNITEKWLLLKELKPVENWSDEFNPDYFIFWTKSLQVNHFQKHLFLPKLTNNMTKDCSLNHQFSTRKFQAQNMLCT